MKRAFSFRGGGQVALLAAGTGLVAATYGLVRLAYGLFLPDVQAELALDDAAAGLVASGASLVYCVGALVGFLVASTHPRRLVAVAAVAAGGGAAGMAAAPDARVFAAAAILSSVGAGLASPALVTIVRRTVTSEANERGQSIVNAGTGPGLVLAGVLALVLLPDWRLAWFVVAAATLAVGVLVLWLDRGPRPALGLPRTGLPPRSWFVAHRVVIVAALLMGAASAAVWTYGRAHLVARGASDAASVGAWVALGLGGAAVIGSARRLGAAGPRAAWSSTVVTLAGASALLGAVPHVTPLALVACVAFGWGYTAGSGVLIAWTTHIEPRRSAAGTSMLFIVLILGQAAGAAAAGPLVGRSSLTVVFLVAAAVAVVAAAVPLVTRSAGASRPALRADHERRSYARR